MDEDKAVPMPRTMPIPIIAMNAKMRIYSTVACPALERNILDRIAKFGNYKS